MSAWWQEMWAFVQHPLMLPMVISAAAGLIAYIAGRHWTALSRWVSLFAAATVLVLTIRLFTGETVTLNATWLAMNEFRLAIAMTNRTFGTLVAMTASAIGLGVGIYALAGERGWREQGRFYAFLAWTLTGTFGAAMADDLIWLLLCWEIVSLCLYMMLNMGRGDARSSAAKSFVMIGFGDAAMLLAIALIAATQGTLQISELSIQVGTPLTTICYLLFLVAALAKAGAVPMHTWIPAAASDASASVFALLPASIDKLLGVYLLVRFSLGVFSLNTSMSILLMLIGAVTVVSAAVMAMIQPDFKRLVAFQAISSTGYIVLGVGTGIPIAIAGGVFHAINGAIYQACLFLGAGNVQRRAGTTDLDHLGGLARLMPGTLLSTTIATMALSGVPPLNGFASKWLIYQGCLSAGSSLAMFCLVAAVFGSALSLAASVKLLAAVFWGTGPDPVKPDITTAGGKVAMFIPMAGLVVLCLMFGVIAQWPMQHLIIPAIADTGSALDPAIATTAAMKIGESGLWAPAPATILILLGVLGGIAFYLIGKTGHVRITNSFIGGELIDDPSCFKLSAAGVYRTLEDMPGLGPALQDGSTGAFDVYRLGGRYGQTLVDVLRQQHSGVLSLYVSWCLVGGVIIATYLIVTL